MTSRAPENHADLALVRDVLSGEEGAVETFILRMGCLPRILDVRNGRLGSPLSEEDLKDLVQDTLQLIWHKLATFGGHSSLETWAYTFCTYQLMNAIRSKRRQPRSLNDDSEELAAEPVPVPLRAALEYEHVYRGLDRLDAPQSEVIRLKHFSALTFVQIAEMLSMPVNTVKTHYYRGLDRLRTLLQPYVREEYA